VVERVSHAFRTASDGAAPTAHDIGYSATVGVDDVTFSAHLPADETSAGRPRLDPTMVVRLQTAGVSAHGRGSYALASSRPAHIVGNTVQRLLSEELGLVEHVMAMGRGLEVVWVLNRLPPSPGALTIGLAVCPSPAGRIGPRRERPYRQR
jgi:hypothetical protein